MATWRSKAARIAATRSGGGAIRTQFFSAFFFPVLRGYFSQNRPNVPRPSPLTPTPEETPFLSPTSISNSISREGLSVGLTDRLTEWLSDRISDGFPPRRPLAEFVCLLFSSRKIRRQTIVSPCLLATPAAINSVNAESISCSEHPQKRANCGVEIGVPARESCPRLSPSCIMQIMSIQIARHGSDSILVSLIQSPVKN